MSLKLLASQRKAQTFETERRLFLKLCVAVGTPRAQACYMMAVADEWVQYLDLAMPDPLSDSFADDYLVTEAMRKNPRLPTGIDTQKRALTSWLAAEDACRETNILLREYSRGNISFPPVFETLLTRVRSRIASILGDLDAWKLGYAESNFRFGPGATSSCAGADVVPSRKILSTFESTPSLRAYLPTILGTGPWGHAVTSGEVAGSKLTFVPKDAKTDRPICVEPHANIFVQLGIGALIRHRLSRFGLNLETQADENRRRALRAYSDGLATIDLSSASDSISYELVWLLLPPDWAALLDLARSPETRYKVNGDRGRTSRYVSHKLEKFSSMGNGYTFELETLIFWALAWACGDEDAVAFGDDIICRSDTAPALIDALSRLGFKVNERKTFLAGTFFESCGVDAWRGHDVRPFYIRKDLHHDSTATHWLRIANAIRRYAHRRNLGFGCDRRFRGAWLFASSADPIIARTALPDGFGDDGLLVNFDEAAPSLVRKPGNGYEGWSTTTIRRRPLPSNRTIEYGCYLTALAWGSPSGTRLLENTRGRTLKEQLRRQVVPTWRELGPWI